MIYLKPFLDTFIIYFKDSTLPDPIPADFISVESLPDGDGILRMDEHGEFYREVFPDNEVLETVPPISTPEEVQAQILMNTELLVMYKELGL